jgi:hypothetical protein
MRSRRNRLSVDQVASILEVLRTDDGLGIVIMHPKLKTDASGMNRIVLLPRQARHFANLLIMHAEEAESDAATSNSNARRNDG